MANNDVVRGIFGVLYILGGLALVVANIAYLIFKARTSVFQEIFKRKTRIIVILVINMLIGKWRHHYSYIIGFFY